MNSVKKMSKQEILRKFFSNSCTKEEADAAMLLIREEPELVDAFLNKDDWDNVDTDQEVPAQLKAEMDEYLFEQTRQRPGVIKMFYQTLAAACLTAILFWGYNTYLSSSSEQYLPGAVLHSNKYEVIENTGIKALLVSLSDGSEVTLSPGARIRYEREFKGKKRDVELSGEALFDVAKDRSRPFSVISNGIKTTALGTQFYVSNFGSKQQQIKLIEGKVVIDAAQKIAAISRVYLVAGQECLLSIDDRSALVKKTRQDNRKSSGFIKAGSREPALVSLNFAHSPMTRVLENLSKHYNTEIIFDRAILSGVYFTGKILEKDSLKRALEIVCEMNTLGFKIEPGLVRIEKR